MSHLSSQVKAAVPHIDSIALIGTDNMYSRLVLEYLQSQLEMPCAILPYENMDQSPLSDATLYLINSDDQADAELNELLDQLQHNEPSLSVALTNTCRTAKSSNLIHWPVIKGIFHKDDDRTLLVKGIRSICGGHFWFSREHLNHLANKRKAPRSSKSESFSLTSRELEILQYITEGMSNQDIADRLFLSPHTIKTHIYNLYKKIDVKSRLQAIQWASEHINIDNL